MPGAHNDRFAAILESSADAIFIVDENGVIVETNPAASTLFGFAYNELIGKNISLIIPSPYHERHDSYIKNIDLDHRVIHVLGVDRIVKARHRSGELLPVEIGLSVYTQQGSHYFVGFIRDVRERQRTEEKFYHLATHDDITGLPNYRLFSERLRTVDLAKRPALLFLGLDGFKRVNDECGRANGDKVLIEVARRWKQALSSGDFLARINGDEFCVLLADTLNNHNYPIEISQRLQEALIKPILLENMRWWITTAIGVAQAPVGGGGVAELLHAAEAAANTAKTYGEGSTLIYSDDLGRRLERSARVEAELHQSCAGGGEGFSLCYQAKVAASTGLVDGAEALIRWTSPDLGAVPPIEFIPVAERSGQVEMISSWVLRHALYELREWERLGRSDAKVAVNFSALDLRHPNIADKVHKQLVEADVNPRRLIIELTESAIAENPNEAAERLSALKELGVSIAIDDFGTGYSSLSYLRRFPLDSLKIDRSFVIDTPDDGDAVAIAQMVRALAGTLGLKTVAEGVENTHQARFLRDIGVDQLQGYLFSRPVPASDFRRLLVAPPFVLPD